MIKIKFTRETEFDDFDPEEGNGYICPDGIENILGRQVRCLSLLVSATKCNPKKKGWMKVKVAQSCLTYRIYLQNKDGGEVSEPVSRSLARRVFRGVHMKLPGTTIPNKTLWIRINPTR